MIKTRKQLVKQLDKLCRQILLIRDWRPGDMFRCISCHCLLPLQVAQVGHFISRRYESTRWDLRNVNLQCASCNKWHSGNLIEYRKTLVEKHGEEEIAFMEQMYRIAPGYSAFDLSLLVEKYQKILAHYKQAEPASADKSNM